MDINTGFVSAAGLVLDIIGAFLLSKGFIAKFMKEVSRETRTYYNGNPYALKSMVQQMIEARAGFVFLAVGFLLQIVTYTGKISEGPNNYDKLLVIGAPLLLVLVAIIIEWFSRLRRIRAVAQEYGYGILSELRNREHRGKYDRPYLNFHAEVFEIKADKDISDEKLAELLKTKIKKYKPARKHKNTWDQLASV